MLSPKTVEKLFFIGLLVFWLLLLAAELLLPKDSTVLSFVSLVGLLLGSFFSVANFRSWRLFLLGFLGADVLQDGAGEKEEGGSKLLYLLQAIVLKTLVVLTVVVLILRDDPQDLPGFLLSFSCYLIFGLFLTVIKAARLHKKAIK